MTIPPRCHLTQVRMSTISKTKATYAGDELLLHLLTLEPQALEGLTLNLVTCP